MEDLETSQIDTETDDFSLIDVSVSDDDFLFASSSSEPGTVDNPGQTFTKGVPTNQPSESLALQRSRKTGKCNLRKSLAWDSAFFTNAGVLDPEELSSIIEGAEMGVNQNPALPGIQEELSKSTDSISTFQSDNVALESLEADLFCDIRASIQRCSKSSTKGSSSGSKFQGEESKNGHATKIVEPTSNKMAKPKSASNKLNSGVQGPIRTLKPGSACKQEIKPPVNRSREPIALPSRPPKLVGRPSLQVAETTKRMSVSSGRVKLDAKASGNMKGGAGKGASLPQASHQVASKKPIPRVPALSKIPAASSALNRTTTRCSGSSNDSSSSSASKNVQKSQTSVIRKKTAKNISMPSVSKTRIPTKVVEKVKSLNKDSHLSAYLKSTSEISSSVSPASSISEWSTESCSSTTTVNQKHLGVNPCASSSQDVIADKALGGPDNRVLGIPSQSPKQPLMGSVLSSIRPGSAKPSGLRMPSPNIGFFDGVKAGAKTPQSISRSRSALPSSLPRSVAGMSSTFGASSMTRLCTEASKITAAAAATAKSKERINNANLKTDSRLPEHSVNSYNPSDAKRIDNDSIISSEFPRSTSPMSDLERNDISEASNLGKYIPDNLTSGLVTFSSEDRPKSNLQSLEANLEQTAFVKDHPIGMQNHPPSASFESNLFKSVLVKDSDVAEVTEGMKPGPELASAAKDDVVASENEACLEEKSQITVDLGIVTAEDQDKTDGGKQELELASVAEDKIVVSDKAHPEGILLVTIDQGNVTAKAQPKTDHHITELASAAEDDVVASEKEACLEEKLLVNVDLGIVTSEDQGKTDGGKQELELASVAEDNIVVSNEAHPGRKLLVTIKQGNVTAEAQPKTFLHITDPNLTPSAQLQCYSGDLQGDSRTKNNDVDSLTSFEISKSTPCKSSSERNSEVTELPYEEKHAFPDFGPVAKDDLIAPEAEQILHLSHDLITEAEVTQDGSSILDTTDCVQVSCASPHFNMEQKNQSSSNIVCNLSPFQHVDKADDDPKTVSQHTEQDEGESVRRTASDKNQSIQMGLEEIKENVIAGNQVEKFEENAMPRCYKVVIQEEPDRSVQSENMLSDKLTSTVLSSLKESCDPDVGETTQFASMISRSPPLPSVGFGSAARTPFTVKNSVSNIAEVSNSPKSAAGLATESYLKVAVVPYPEKSQKENN